MPSSRELAGDKSVELNRFGHQDSSASLELDKPLSRLPSPNVAVVALLSLELLGVFGGALERLEVMVQLDLLVERLLLGVVTVEEFRL